MADDSVVPPPEEGEAEKKSTVVKVHPLVVFSILDHFIRRQQGQERVIGTLLGERDDATGTVVISNAFAVPHTEKDGEVAVGQATNKTMYSLLSRVNPSERIVGWYATADDVGNPSNESSLLIHDFYIQECGMPVHLVVDTSLVDGVRLRALEGLNPDSVLGLPAKEAFAELECDLTFTDSERSLLDAMINGIVDDRPFENGESLSVLPSQMDDVEDNVDDLLDLVDDVSRYVDRVGAGKIKNDPEADRHIADALGTLPRLAFGAAENDAEKDETDEPKSNDDKSVQQDIVMVSYLATLTKAQLAIASKIHSTF